MTETLLVVSKAPAILKKILHGSFHVIERTDVNSALELLKTTPVDLIILDALVKEGHIFPAAEQFRKIVTFDTPILLVTTNLKKSFVESALDAGITDFLHEPLDRDEVEERISVALKAKQRHKQITQIALHHTPSIQSAPTLSDRKLLNDRALKEINKARKTSTILSLLLIELHTPNAFEYLSTFLRKNDILIPQGAGKFLLLLPKTSKRAAEIIAETLRSEAPVSIGLICLDKSTPTYGNASADFEHLIEGASRAMRKKS